MAATATRASCADRRNRLSPIGRGGDQACPAGSIHPARCSRPRTVVAAGAGSPSRAAATDRGIGAARGCRASRAAACSRSIAPVEAATGGAGFTVILPEGAAPIAGSSGPPGDRIEAGGVQLASIHLGLDAAQAGCLVVDAGDGAVQAQPEPGRATL